MKKNINCVLAICLVVVHLLAITSFVSASERQQRDRFVFTQLKYEGNWDPYPFVYPDILNFLTITTSVKVLPERRVVTIKDKLLFSSPWVFLLNNGKFTKFTEEERKILKCYLLSGGSIFIEDNSSQKRGRFDILIREELKKIFPDKKLTKIPRRHAMYRSFYLLRGISGRRIVNNYLEELDIDGRTAVIYSQNDIFGAWARDKFGNYFWACKPGGETQRFEAMKLTIDIIIFSLTGTYKTDTIHQPYIERKLRR